MSQHIPAEIFMEDERKGTATDTPCPVGSDLSGYPGRFEPSDRLRVRIERLAGWRIDKSSITFPESAIEFYGGHATVSKACGRLHFSIEEVDLAVKRMRIASDTNLERILGLAIREAEFLAELSHPNIASFQGFVEDASEGIIWLVFLWAEGGNLKDFVASVDWEVPERISLINDVAKGLAYLHSQNPPICHGDLKSLNVLVDNYCRAAITDFGSARRLSQRDGQDEVVSQRQPVQPLNAAFCASTNTITLTGHKYTIRWAAPELLIEDRASLSSDIWALGWIAYEVMTNSLPFQDASTDMVVIQRVLGGQLPSLTEKDHLSIVQELCSLMNMCWQYSSAKRPTADYCRECIQQMPMFAPYIGISKTEHRTLVPERLTLSAHMHQSWGEYARAYDLYFMAIERLRGFRDAQPLISGLRNLAQLHQTRDEYDKAFPLYSEMVELCTSCGDREGKAEALWALAGLHRLRREYDKAISLYSEVLEIWANVGYRRGRPSALWALADVHRLRGEYDKAVELYCKTLEMWTSPVHVKGRAEVMCCLGDVHRLRGEYDQAMGLYDRVLEICQDPASGREAQADALCGLADVHRHRGEYEKAIPLYHEVLKMSTDLNEIESRVDALCGLADAHRRREEYDTAVPLYYEALGLLTRLNDEERRADALWGLADVHRLRDEYDAAMTLYLEVLKIRAELGDRKGRASALWGLADVHRSRGEHENASPLYYEVLQIRTDLGDKEGTFDALLGIADVRRDQHRWSDAVCLYDQAAEIAQQLGHSEAMAEALNDAAACQVLQL